MDNNPPPASEKKKNAWEKVQEYMVSSPFLVALGQLRQNYETNKAKFLLIGFVVIAVLVIIFGLLFGSTLGRILRPSPIVIPDLPSITPTVVDAVPSSFDSLRNQVRQFSGVLPDPAPPAVDHNINLQAPRR